VFPFILFLFSFVLVAAEFVKTLLDIDESAWQQLGDETVPPEKDWETLANLAGKLARWVPRSFLKEHISDTLPPQRGEIVRLEGTIYSVTKYDGKVPVYCCRMDLHNGGAIWHADIFTPSIPQAWKQQEWNQNNLVIHERIAAYGVYIKSYFGGCKISGALPQPPYTGTLGFEPGISPVFVTPAIEWYPDTWLGNLGFDVSAFDHVPVSRVITEALEQNDEETNRRTFKFTESDRDAFYGLLRAVSATSAGWLEQEAEKQQTEMPISVTDLFNHPSETRGKPVLLRGTAKRIVPTPVTDSEVPSLFGIDHYYQIYFFTEQSQGNPIVVCVHSLPEGMPTGEADDFSEAVTVAAIPYKLWVYETSAGRHDAPVLVGRSPVWHPKPAEQRLPPKLVTTISFAVFFTLVLIWFACRYWSKCVLPRFKL
jgi:hypothetical protein